MPALVALIPKWRGRRALAPWGSGESWCGSRWRAVDPPPAPSRPDRRTASILVRLRIGRALGFSNDTHQMYGDLATGGSLGQCLGVVVVDNLEIVRLGGRGKTLNLASGSGGAYESPHLV